MDESWIAALPRVLSPAWSRRGLTWLLGGLLIGEPLAILGQDSAEAKRKGKKKKKKRSCPICPPPSPPPPPSPSPSPSPDCPAERACSNLCCPEGDLCIDPFTKLCASGAGSCPPGVDVCGQPADDSNCSREPGGDPNGSCFCFITLRGFSFCGSTGGCNPMNDQCESDVECVAELQDVAARCVQGPSCCGGGTQCRRPCPT